VNEASAYTTRTLTAGRATAKARIEQARGQADRAVTLARGRADRFLALLTEAQSDRRLTIRRLYLQAVRELWEKAGRKLVLTPDEPLDLTLYGTR
jgi:membrane protease subunit HflK